MFPIDLANLPHLRTRQALLLVDFQNDFVAADGLLPVTAPEGFVDRTADLAKAFRQHGDVIWVRSEFETSRPPGTEQIVFSDAPPVTRTGTAARDRRRVSASHSDAEEIASPEAFLTAGTSAEGKPQCVRVGSLGCDFPPTIQAALKTQDRVLVKSHYSAFKSDQILQILRTRLITELFICGSLTNIGVYATALDAASYGYEITIVEDCCGYRSVVRHHTAVRQLTSLTGCQILTSEDVLENVEHKSPRKTTEGKLTGEARRSGVAATTASTVRRARPEKLESSSSDLHSSLAKLKLSDESAAPEASPQAGLYTLQPISSGSLDKEADGIEAATSKLASLKVDADGTRPAPASSNDDDSPDRLSSQPRARKGTKNKPNRSSQKQSETTDDVSTEIPPPAERKGPPKAESEKSSATPSAEPTKVFIDSLKSSQVPNSQSSRSTQVDVPDKVSQKVEKTPESTTVSSPPNWEETTTLVTDQADLVEGEPLCEGDTRVIYNVLPPKLADHIFERIRDEVRWQRMSHQGGEVPRLVAVQGDIATDGSMPIYRHPSDESPPLLPFSATVLEVKEEIEKHLEHPLNHVLIQFYRDGNDYISEHTDKTLDIVKESFIANVSLGAERTMTLRTKRKPKDKEVPESEKSSENIHRRVERTRLPHNSLCKMGLVTNMRWLHGIRQDKRQDREKSEAELAYDGGRISLTFRQIGTFVDRDNKLIWGQGATGKTRDEAHEVINGQTPEAIRMLQAFGKENQTTDFDWNEFYGAGFDNVHISMSPRLFTSSDAVVNQRIQIMLAEYGIGYAKGSMSPLFNWKDGKLARDNSAIPAELPIKFVDTDPAKSQVQGDLAIMLYLDSVYGPKKAQPSSAADLARTFTRFQEALGLLQKWRAAKALSELKRELSVWESYATGAEYMAGAEVSLVDFALWPVLHDIAEANDGKLDGHKSLEAYYERINDREATKKALGLRLPKPDDTSTPKEPETGTDT